MTPRGRKPKPDYLKVVPGGKSRPNEWDDGRCGYPTASGHPCKRPATESGRCWEPSHTDDVERESYPPPAHLGDIASECWRAYIEEAVRLGIITQLDWPLFETLCELYESKRRSYDAWRDTETVQQGRNNEPVKNKAWTQYKQAAESIRKVLSEMGFTPTSRNKLDLTDDEGYDPLAGRIAG